MDYSAASPRPLEREGPSPSLPANGDNGRSSDRTSTIPGSINAVVGIDVECFVREGSPLPETETIAEKSLVTRAMEWGLIVSPFFFWGTAMVAMKRVIPKAGPFFVGAFRLIPAGAMLIGFAAFRGEKTPGGAHAWLSIAAFGFVDACCFQGFLAQGLQKTSAGLGSVIIDSQPLTVAVLAAVLFRESIGVIGAAGLAVGVVGLLIIEYLYLSMILHSGAAFQNFHQGISWLLSIPQYSEVQSVMEYISTMQTVVA